MIQTGAKNTVRIQLNDLVSYIALFIAFYCATNGELRYTQSNMTYYLPFAVCGVALLFELMSRRIVLSSYLVWRVLLIVFFTVTMVYAISYDAAFVGFKVYVLQSIVVLLIALKCSSNPENIKKIMMIAVLACACTTAYIFLTVDLSSVGGSRLGVSTINMAWNANNIGTMSAFGALLTFCVTFVFVQKRTRRYLVISILLMLAFGYIMVLSGSRKSILIILITILLYIMRAQSSKRVSNTLLAVVILILAIYAIYNVPFLYQHVGVRFEGGLETLFGEGGDKSAMIRQEMVDMGWAAFWDKPFFGYGLNGFAVLWEAENGSQAYAHNNYIEMLVAGGVFGAALYYSYMGKMLLTKTVQSKQTAFIKGMLVAFLLADVGCVSYNDPFLQYVLCLVVYSIVYAPAVSKLYDDEKEPEELEEGVDE